jgi:hypothetical protein
MLSTKATFRIFLVLAALFAGVALTSVYRSNDEELQEAVFHPLLWALAGYILYFFGFLRRYWLHYFSIVVIMFFAISCDNELFWEETTGRVLDLFFEQWIEGIPGSGWVRWYKRNGDDLEDTIRHIFHVSVASLLVLTYVFFKLEHWIAVNVFNHPQRPDIDPCHTDYEPATTTKLEPVKYYQSDYDRYNNALHWSAQTGRECPPLSHFLDARRIHGGRYFS